MKIPLSSPDITEAEIEAVTAVMRTSRLSLGPQLDAFEAAFASYIGVEHAIGVSSGTAGLHLCIRASEHRRRRRGHRAVIHFHRGGKRNSLRARTVLSSSTSNRESLNLSPAAVGSRDHTAELRAIMAIHTFGRPAEMTALLEMAHRHNFAVIEDACEALGAEYHGRRVGSFGDAAVFGFYPNKQITTGEGGMVLTRNAKLAERIRALRNQGRYPDQ